MRLTGFVGKDLYRNPRRTLASLIGVIVGVGLFSAVLFFIDGSGASMTRRAVAPLSLDMQRVLTSPLGGGLRYERKVADASVKAGDTTRVTLTVRNEGLAPAHEVVVRDRLREPFTYVPGSTLLDGEPVDDVDGTSPLAQGAAGTGLNIGDAKPDRPREITYRVTTDTDVPVTPDVPSEATISTREVPTPAKANAARPMPLAELAQKVRRVPGVQAANPLVFVNLPGNMTAGDNEVEGPVKLFSFDADYQARYPGIKMLSGGIKPGSVVISAEAARDLKVHEGDSVDLELPGVEEPLVLPVSGVTDLSGARPLFESREWRRFEKFVYAPYTVIVDPQVYAQHIAPAFEAEAAKIDTELGSAPFEELDILVDRASLNADPATALAQTLDMAAAVKGVAPEQDYLLDNVSNTLAVAKGDAIIAKRMFVFLGLPGAILAAVLTAYAGNLLAGAQRRESALLRVRGASKRHLLYLLSLRTLALAGIGSLLGTALGFASVLVLLGPSILFEASTPALVQSGLIGLLGGMIVTALALYIPGRRLVSRELNAELGSAPRRSAPAWRRMTLEGLALAGAAGGQIWALSHGAFDGPAGSVYSGRSVSLPLHLLIAPIVAWLAGTMLIAHILQAVTGRSGTARSGRGFTGLVTGVLWRSITRRLSALAGGVVTVGLVVGLGTMLACFATAYDRAEVDDARFGVGSDIRLTPNPTSPAPHPTALSRRLAPDGAVAAAAVVYAPENAVLSSAFVDEEVTTLAAVDPFDYAKVAALRDSLFTGGTAAQMMQAMRDHPDGVLLNTALSESMQLKPGDTTRILFARGEDEQVRAEAKVLGTFTRFPGAPKATDVVANLEFYQQTTQLTDADYYLVAAADRSPAGLDRAVQSLRAMPDFERRFDVATATASLDKDKSSLTALNVRGLLHLDSFFTFLMAATATAMFVFGLLMQRRREYVTLRAQGLHSREVRRLVLAESGISATLGAVIGLAVGIGIAGEFVRILRPIFTLAPPLDVPVSELGTLAGLVVGATGVAAVAATVLINRLKPTELLRDE
jgi:putative ABC transport system permease protein